VPERIKSYENFIKLIIMKENSRNYRLIMRYIYICLILIITLTSCKEKQTKYNAREIIVSTETDNGNLLTSEFIDTSYFIPLETNDNCLIKEIHKIVFDGQRIFILDPYGSKKVFIFDNKGKFMNSVGNIGQGPGEYTELYDFCIDSVSRQIFLLCSRGAIMCYDYTGNFKKKYTPESDFPAYKMEYFDEHFYFIIDEIDLLNLTITDNQFKIEQKFFPDENKMILMHPLKVVDSGIQYTRYIDNYVYLIKDHKDIINQYAIDFGKNTIDFSDLKNLSENVLNEKMETSRGNIYSFTQNTEHAIVYYMDNYESVISIYDKKSRTAKNYFLENIYDKYLGNYYPLFFRYLTANKEFVADIYPAMLFQKNPTEYVKEMHILEDDNPVLYVVKMK
jgi:hypothetical protein